MGLLTRKVEDAEPWWPTAVRSRKRDGRVLGTDGSVWLYAKVPLSPVTDARSPEEALAAGEQIRAVLEEIASTTHVRVTRRAMAKSSYRNVHLLLVNVPTTFAPPDGSQLFAHLSSTFADTDVLRRLLLVGVRLQDKVGGSGGLRSAIDSVAETIAAGTIPLEDFDEDFATMSAIMARVGLNSITDADFALANAWWNEGKAPDTPMLVHDDHVHVFSSTASMQAAARLVERDGDDNCESWELTKHHTLCFACVRDFEIGYPDATSHTAQWASSLVESGAGCVSIRGKLEPSAVTGAELRRGKKKYSDDINERYQQNKMARGEQEEMLAQIDELERHYSTGGPATLMECSTVVVSSGVQGRNGYDMSEFAPDSSLVLSTMVSRQNSALAETWLASPVRANPYLHDLPTIMVAVSGLAGLSTVGDRDGALLGFTENDRQPAYMSPTSAMSGDELPIFVGVGQTGSGKTLSMLYLADQFARITTANGEKTPVIIIDPKAGSDHSAVVEAAGGTVASLDDLLSGDGIFDPIRFSKMQGSGVEQAASMLMTINPWGEDARNYEMPVQKALAYGVSRGADCVGVALTIARDDGIAPKDMVDKVLDLAISSPMFRACVGSKNGGQSLKAAEGITLIKVGDAKLVLPPPGAHVSEMNLNQRVALSLVRMMVFGSASALAMRSGVLMLDEGWIMLSAGRSEMEELGRLARAQQVFPMVFTQRVTDALNAGLSGYISRGLILPIQDATEAAAACELFRLETTPERMSRITAKATLGSSANEVGTAPNWNSMRSLRDPITGEVLRGAVGIYCDLAGRAVPVEISLPHEFLKMSSTNIDDIRERLAERAAETTLG